MKKTTLSNYDLERLGSAIKMPLWVGMRDEFDREVITKYNYFIINIQPERMQGQHWTGLWKYKTPSGKTYCIFFDPFGASPMKEIIDVCKKEGFRLMYSHTDCQDFKSDCCGWICLAFFICMRRKMTFKSFSSHLETGKNKIKNDAIVKKIVLSEWQKYLTINN